MKRLFSVSILSFALAGCALNPVQKTSTFSTNPTTGVVTTNTVVSVNQAVLDGECVVVQLAAEDVASRLAKSPASIQLFRDIETALTGIISGADTNSASRVIGLIGTKNLNPLEAQQISNGIALLSKFEQGEIQKYGNLVGVQIAIAVAKAINAGLAIAVPMQ